LFLIGALVVYPAIYSIYLSLTNASLVGAAATNPRLVGMRNYVRLFADGGFWNSLVITFWFVLGSAVIGQFVLGLVSGLLLRRPPASVVTRCRGQTPGGNGRSSTRSF